MRFVDDDDDDDDAAGAVVLGDDLEATVVPDQAGDGDASAPDTNVPAIALDAAFASSELTIEGSPEKVAATVKAIKVSE